MRPFWCSCTWTGSPSSEVCRKVGQQVSWLAVTCPMPCILRLTLKRQLLAWIWPSTVAIGRSVSVTQQCGGVMGQTLTTGRWKLMDKSFLLTSHRRTILRHDTSCDLSEDVFKDSVINSTGYKAMVSLEMYHFVFALLPVLSHSFPFTVVSLG